jgi:hypothetical protein
MMRAVSGLLWLITILATLVSAIDFFFASATADSAPQQAAGAAMAVAQVAVPYVLARAFDELSGVNRPAKSKPAELAAEKKAA